MRPFAHALPGLAAVSAALLLPPSLAASVGTGTGATLLLPYLQVDLDDPAGVNTLVAVGNAGEAPVVAHFVLWTDWGVPTFAFDVVLEAEDVHTLSLRDVFVRGELPLTPSLGLPDCVDFIVPPTLDDEERAALAAQHTGAPHPGDGLCYGSDRRPGIAKGYLTFDAARRCAAGGVDDPTDEGYFAQGGNGLVSNDNVLWGDYFYVDPDGNSAQGEPLVALRADAEAS